MVNWVLVKRAEHPWSQSWPIDKSAWLASPGKMWASVAAAGRPGRLMWQVWVDQMLLPSGSLTWIGVVAGAMWVHGLSVRR